MRNGKDGVFASPLARRLASERGLDLGALPGSGPRGRIIKRDVERAGSARPPSAEEDETIEDGEAGASSASPGKSPSGAAWYPPC